MNFIIQHIQILVSVYQGEMPLAIFLKAYFRKHPKLGSRDRKAISEALFLYYRYARHFPDTLGAADVISAAVARLDSPNPFLEKMLGTSPDTHLSAFDYSQNSLPELRFSSGITVSEWQESLLTQPRLFIRIRENAPDILATLTKRGIPFAIVPVSDETTVECLSLPNSTPLEQWLSPGDYVIQDWASQKSMQPVFARVPSYPFLQAWDVCAGAGGKSLLLKDRFPAVRLYATDIRARILANLTERFRGYGLEPPAMAVVDAVDAEQLRTAAANRLFDLILCDVPCTGSGTWARTPEQFHFFRPEQLKKFRQLQFPIALNASHFLKPGGLLVYITCSVLYDENEAVVEQLLQTTSLQLQHQELINGLPHHADCLFVAVFSSTLPAENPPK